jgi:fructose-1,6-bisphosphatase/inositol monophosphatase family enzyme
MTETANIESLIQPLRRLHEIVREAVVKSCERSAVEDLAAIAREEEGDTIYEVDRVSEELLVDFFEREIAAITSVVLIAEGLPSGKVTFPSGVEEQDARFRIIVDPIDGTRGLMYQKRSGWILTGVAPNKGANTSLRDIELCDSN